MKKNYKTGEELKENKNGEELCKENDGDW